jgi:hypothetical protein
VISAHQSCDFDDVLRRDDVTRDAEDVSGYFYIRKNLLMSDANETRL